MAYERVTEVQQVIDWRLAQDKSLLTADLEAIKVSHAEICVDHSVSEDGAIIVGSHRLMPIAELLTDMTNFHISHRSEGIVCETCSGPTVVAECKSCDGRRICRAIIDAVKLASIAQQHELRLSRGDICYNCKLLFNGLNRIAGAVHMDHEINDQARGDGTIGKGLNTLINEGLVDIDTAEGIVIHDLSHTDLQHCRGCEKIRHPQCPRIGLCLDAVAVPIRES